MSSINRIKESLTLLIMTDIDENSKKLNKKKTKNKPRIGLALSSGVAKGFAHIGVIRGLVEHGFEPNIVAGTSIGAVAGASYATGKLDAFEKWGLSLSRFKLMSYLDFRVKSGGLIGGKRILKLLEKNFSGIDIEDLPYPFLSVAADMSTGHEVWLRKGSLVDAVRASFSLPAVFPPVFMDNRWLLDGALVNPVPVSPCRALGAQMVIAVNLGGDFIGKARKRNVSYPTVSGFDVLGEDNPNKSAKIKALKDKETKGFFKRSKNSPSLFGVMMATMNISQDRLARSRMAGDPPDVMISPRVGHIGLMEFDRAQECIDAGYESVERAIPYIKDAYEVLVADRYAQHDHTDFDI